VQYRTVQFTSTITDGKELVVSTAPTSAELRPYRVEIAQADLADLRERLDRVRWPDELADAGWSYGVPLASTSERSAHSSSGTGPDSTRFVA
jgi:hypothetical protein